MKEHVKRRPESEEVKVQIQEKLGDMV